MYDCPKSLRSIDHRGEREQAGPWVHSSIWEREPSGGGDNHHGATRRFIYRHEEASAKWLSPIIPMERAPQYSRARK